MYEQGLSLRLGEDEMEKLKTDNLVRKIDTEYLRRIRAIYAYKIRKLEKKLAWKSQYNQKPRRKP